MSRLKFPLTRRDKYFIFGNEDQALDDLEGQEFYIKGAVYKPGAMVNADGTVPLKPTKEDPRKQAMSQALVRRYLEGQPPLASNEESWSNLVPIGGGGSSAVSPARSSPVVELEAKDPEKQRLTSGNGAAAEKTSLNSAALPLGSEAANTHNTTLGTIREEKFDPGDFVIKYYASISDMIWFVWTLLMYLADIVSDIVLAAMYWSASQQLYFSLTLGFIAVPSLAMMIFSLVLYVRDYRIVGERASPIRWVSRIFFLVLQLGPLLRIVDAFLFGMRSRHEKESTRQKRLYERMMDEDVDGMMIRMFEAFMQAAPQLVLQFYVMTQLKLDAGVGVVSAQCVALAFSLVSVAVSMVSFQKSMRVSQPDKALLTRPAMIIMFAWRVLTIGARVTALAMFASKFHYYVFVVIGIHWMVMFFWVTQQDTKYCTVVNERGEDEHSSAGEFGFRVMTSFVHIFAWFNIVEGHTRLRCAVFYTVMFVENFGMVIIFYVDAAVSGSAVWYDIPAVLFVTIGFAGGILLQIVYYKLFHPNNFSYLHEDKVIRWWIPLKDLSICYDPTWNLDDLDRQAERVPMHAPPPMVSSAGPPPAVKFLRPILRNPSSGSESSNRSNFIKKTEMDADARAQLNLQYRKPARMDEILSQSAASPNASHNVSAAQESNV